MRFFAVLVSLLPLCAQTPDQKLAREIFKQLIEINTTDSSGDNTRAAEAMAARFRAAGYPADDIQVLAPVPRKGNLVVRLRGTGAARPILFLGHLDVVEARRSDWPWDPFEFREQEGYFYGRGTSDMKGDDATLVGRFPAYEARELSAGARSDPRADLRRGRRPSQRRGLAGHEAPRTGGRAVLHQYGFRRRPHQERQARLHGHAGRGEGLPQLQAGSHQSRRTQLAAGEGQRHLPSGRRTLASREVRFSGPPVRCHARRLRARLPTSTADNWART